MQFDSKKNNIIRISDIGINSPIIDSEYNNYNFTGDGIIKFKNGDRYLGKIFQGKPHGIGIFVFKSGYSIKGTWVYGEYSIKQSSNI